MNSYTKSQNIFLISIFTVLLTDTALNWNAYHACSYPIQSFLIITYSLIIAYKAIQTVELCLQNTRWNSPKLIQALNIVLVAGFIYTTVQGIVWQEKNIRESPDCIPEDRLPNLIWVWIGILILIDIAALVIIMSRIIRWWRIRSYRRRIQTLVDEIMVLHGQQAQRLEDFLTLMPVTNDIEPTLNNQVGLCKEDLNKLPKRLYTKRSRKFLSLSQQHLCPICFEDFKLNEEVSTLPVCRHMFHFRCIERWLSQNPLCPLCRNNVRDDLTVPLLRGASSMNEETESTVLRLV